jgi:hypothetical protein
MKAPPLDGGSLVLGGVGPCGCDFAGLDGHPLRMKIVGQAKAKKGFSHIEVSQKWAYANFSLPPSSPQNFLLRVGRCL